MNLYDLAVWVLKENLIPPRYRPAAIIRITDTEFIAAAHESLDVICPEAEMSVAHRVYELLHFKASVEITLGPVKFNVAVGEEVDFASVSSVVALAADNSVLIIGDGTEFEQLFVERC